MGNKGLKTRDLLKQEGRGEDMRVKKERYTKPSTVHQNA